MARRPAAKRWRRAVCVAPNMPSRPSQMPPRAALSVKARSAATRVRDRADPTRRRARRPPARSRSSMSPDIDRAFCKRPAVLQSIMALATGVHRSPWMAIQRANAPHGDRRSTIATAWRAHDRSVSASRTVIRISNAADPLPARNAAVLVIAACCNFAVLRPLVHQPRGRRRQRPARCSRSRRPISMPSSRARSRISTRSASPSA